MTSKTQLRADLAVDAFVERVTSSARDPLAPDMVPEFLRPGPAEPEHYGWVPWTIRRATTLCAWLDDFEAKLPRPLPRSFKSLVTRYLFPAFDVGPVTLFANTGGAVQEAWELSTAAFVDTHLAGPLLAAGLVQFGRPSGSGSYDPICFDLNSRTNAGECPIVQVDHELVLCEDRVEVGATLAPSILALIADTKP